MEIEDEATPLVKKSAAVAARNKKAVKRKTSSSGDGVTQWLVLALCCSVMAGMYYILAMPATLHNQLNAIMPNPDHFEINFSLLFTVSYVPNMILPLFGAS